MININNIPLKKPKRALLVIDCSKGLLHRRRYGAGIEIQYVFMFFKILFIHFILNPNPVTLLFRVALRWATVVGKAYLQKQTTNMQNISVLNTNYIALTTREGP